MKEKASYDARGILQHDRRTLNAGKKQKQKSREQGPCGKGGKKNAMRVQVRSGTAGKRMPRSGLSCILEIRSDLIVACSTEKAIFNANESYAPEELSRSELGSKTEESTWIGGNPACDIQNGMSMWPAP